MQKEYKCKECDSTQIRKRVKTNDWKCYRCGNEFKVEEEIIKGDKE